MTTTSFPETDLRFNPDEKLGLGDTMQWFLMGGSTTDADGNLLPQFSDRLGKLEESSGETWPETVRNNAEMLAKGGLYPGEDFVVVPYVGTPKTAAQNAGNAQRYGSRGVEVSAITKSFAGVVETGNGPRIIILTGPSDLQFKTDGLVAGQIGSLEPLDDEMLSEIGMEHGTVNPVGAVDGRKPGNLITYLFDKDLVDKKHRDPAKKVYISGGDPHWSILLDIRKLITLNSGISPTMPGSVSDICERGPEAERMRAIRDIVLVTGDSAQVGSGYFGELEANVRNRLIDSGAYNDDSSMPNLSLHSLDSMAGTGDLQMHSTEVIARLREFITRLPNFDRPALLAFTSNAANLPSFTTEVESILAERPDYEQVNLVTVSDALKEHIDKTKPSSVAVFGLPDVVNEYPDSIGDVPVVKTKGKTAQWMQIARNGTDEEKETAAKELKREISNVIKRQMAKQKGLEGREIGEFMKDQDVILEGTVILAGTELWDILGVATAEGNSAKEDRIELVDPIKLLMNHLSGMSVSSLNS